MAGGERVRAFVPAPLPPDLTPSPELQARLDAALLALGRLDGISAGRSAGSADRVHAAFRERPLWTIAKLKTATGLPVPTVTRAIAALEKLRIVRETSGRKRGRVYAYGACLSILSEGTAPP